MLGDFLALHAVDIPEREARAVFGLESGAIEKSVFYFRREAGYSVDGGQGFTMPMLDCVTPPIVYCQVFEDTKEPGDAMLRIQVVEIAVEGQEGIAGKFFRDLPSSHESDSITQ
jgi:hypothetical protein